MASATSVCHSPCSIREQKVRVTGFDIDQRKVTTLTQGGSYIVRILPSEIQQARAQGFEATSDYARLTEMDAIIICVPTPLNEYHEPDLSYITDTAKAIAPHLRAGQLVVLESTTYPGTTEEVMVPILEKGNKHGLKAARGGPSNGQEIYVAFSPEREDPGNTRWPAATFRKSWAVSMPRLRKWQPRCTEPSSTASCASPHRQRRR